MLIRVEHYPESRKIEAVKKCFNKWSSWVADLFTIIGKFYPKYNLSIKFNNDDDCEILHDLQSEILSLKDLIRDRL